MDHVRLMTLGASLTALGGSAAVAYWIYTLQAKKSFFVAAGWISLGVLAVGLLLLAVGCLRWGGEGGARQRQRGGRGSTNLQAGDDIRIGGDR